MTEYSPRKQFDDGQEKEMHVIQYLLHKGKQMNVVQHILLMVISQTSYLFSHRPKHFIIVIIFSQGISFSNCRKAGSQAEGQKAKIILTL